MASDVEVKIGADASKVPPETDKAIASVNRLNQAVAQSAKEINVYGQAWDRYQHDYVKAWDQAAAAAKRGTSALSSGLNLNRAQIQEFAGIARHSLDQLAAGASPLTVVGTHAASLAQAMGSGSGGLGGALKGLLGFLSPAVIGFAALAVGIGLAVKATFDYQNEVQQASLHLEGLGRASGLTVDAYLKIAEASSAAAHITVHDAEDMENALLSTGEVGSRAFETLIGLSRDYAATMGVDAKQATKDLAAAMADPTTAAETLDSKLHFLDAQTLDLIRTMQEQGEKEQAGVVLANKLAEATHGAAEQTSLWAQFWHEVGKNADNAFRAVGQAIQRGQEQEIASNSAMVSAGIGEPDPVVAQQQAAAKAAADKKAQAERNAAAQTARAIAEELLPQHRRIEQIQNHIIALQTAVKKGVIDEATATAAIAQGRRQIHDLKASEARVGQSGVHHEKGPGLMEQYRTALAAQLADEANADKTAEQMTVDFWQAKVGTAKRGSREELEIERALSEAKIALQRRQRADAAKHFDEMMRDFEKYAAHEKELQIRAADDEAEVAANAARRDMEVRQAAAQEELLIVDRKLRQGQINEEQAARERERINDRLAKAAHDLAETEFQIEIQALRDKLNVWGIEPDERERINAQIEKLEREHADNMRAIDAGAAASHKQDEDAALKAREARYRSSVQGLVGVWRQGIQGMIEGTTSFRQVWARFGSEILSQFLGWVEKMVVNWVTAQVAQTAAAAAGAQARVGIEATAGAQSTAITAFHALKQIAIYAYKAAAAAYSAIAGIPYIGPFLAPAMAAAALAGVIALGKSIFSAAGGFGDVPFDNAVTALHKNEMVLPADIATPLRNQLRSAGGLPAAGGAGGRGPPPVALNVHAMDARSFDKWLRGPAGDRLIEYLYDRRRGGAALATS